MRYLKLNILFLTINILISSCGCDCDCTRNLGCIILTEKVKSSNKIKKTKMFCSKNLTNFSTDSVLLDSVKTNKLLFQTDSIIFIQRDSIYKYETIGRLKCEEIKNYVNIGFYCNCAK